MKRNEQREVIMKLIYEIEMREYAKTEYNIDDIINSEVDNPTEYIINTTHEVINNSKELDSLANKYLKDWTIDRLGRVDRAILELGIYEVTKTSTPAVVAINEAIELSHKYSDSSVTSMINSVLDKVYHEEVK